MDQSKIQMLEEENAQLKLELRNTQRELQDFVYVVSHDLGAPLRAIVSFSDIVQQKYGAQFDDRGRSYLQFIKDGGVRMQQMLAGLLSFSRVETQAKPFELIDLAELCDQTQLELDEKIFETKAVIERGNLPMVWGDSNQMHQMLMALFDNALTYHRPDCPPHIAIVADDEPGHVRLRIVDNGIGIPSEYVDRVFQVFKRLHADREYPGIGMGLSIARRIVERHNGEIGINPSYAEGTEVWCLLPKPEADMLPMPDLREARHA